MRDKSRSDRHRARGDASRAALLAAASDLMIERRTIEVSLNEIAARAGLNAALIRYYFGSKQGMMLALLESVIGQGVDEMQALIASDRTPAEKLRRHITGIVTVNARYPYIARLIHALFQDDEVGPALANAISRPVAEGQRTILDEGIALGAFRPIDPASFFFIVFGAAEHLFRQPELLKFVYRIDSVSNERRGDYADTLVDVILRGLAVPAVA